jgi:hypothetical protein
MFPVLGWIDLRKSFSDIAKSCGFGIQKHLFYDFTGFRELPKAEIVCYFFPKNSKLTVILCIIYIRYTYI